MQEVDTEGQSSPGGQEISIQEANPSTPSSNEGKVESKQGGKSGAQETVREVAEEEEGSAQNAKSPASEDPKSPTVKDGVPQRAISGSSSRTGSSTTGKGLQIRWSNSKKSPPTGIHWYLPTAMVFLALFGFFGALGHHLYNKRLHGQEVVEVAWPQRFGIALAFFIKMVLVGAVQIAFKQRAWVWLLQVH